MLVYPVLTALRKIQKKRKRVDSMSEKSMEEMRKEMDTDGDCEISFDEFKAYVMSSRNKKAKIKALALYIGDKAVDLAVISLTAVAFIFFGYI